MSTDTFQSKSLTPAEAVEALRPGTVLDQTTFHHLYEQTPADFKAELIGGIVHMASPLRVSHGRLHSLLIAWLRAYCGSMSEADVLDNATVILADESEPQPDASLRYERGTSRVSDDDYCIGPPELVVEVSQSTVTHDLVAKRADYERNGVSEYLVFVVPESRVVWFRREKEGGFTELSPSDGYLKSHVFPGLWLDAAAFFQMDYERVMAVLNEGLRSGETGS